jgi:hypothetical protein
MTKVYRGIKYDPKTIKNENKPQPGIYRGVKHDPIVAEKSKSPKSGSYRGVSFTN